MYVIQKVITALRSQRKDVGVPEKEIVNAKVYCADGESSLIAGCLDSEANQHLCNSLAKVKLEVKFEEAPFNSLVHSETGFDVEILFRRTIDVPVERNRLTKDIAKYEKGLAAAERQLGNAAFLSKAPPEVVLGLRKQEAETRMLLNKARSVLDALPKE
jgi:valyl-tRNA synthetase